MLKRTLALAVLVAAVVVPAALAADGAPQKPSHPNAAKRHSQSAGERGAAVEQKLAHIRQKIAKAVAGFNKHCASHHANAERCTAAAKKLLAGLQKIDGRIDGLVAKIHEHCDANDSCKRADQLVKKLTDVQAELQRAEEKLQAWLDGTKATDASSDGTSLESLDELSGELAALRSSANP